MPRRPLRPAQGRPASAESIPAALLGAHPGAPPDFLRKASVPSPFGRRPARPSPSSVRGRAPSCSPTNAKPSGSSSEACRTAWLPHERVGHNGPGKRHGGPPAVAVVVTALIVHTQSLCPAARLTSRSACAPVHQKNPSGAYHLMVVARHGPWFPILAYLMCSEKILDRRSNTLPEFRSALLRSPSAREPIRRGRRGGGGRRIWPRKAARRFARGSGQGLAPIP